MTAKKVKQLEDKIRAIEQWIDYHEEPAGIPNILENMNFLLEAVRKDKDQFQVMREQQASERNTMNLLGKFLEKKELMKDWEEFFKAEQEQMEKEAKEQGIKAANEEKEKSD